MQGRRSGPAGRTTAQDQGASQAAAPALGLGLEAIQGMTNAMNAIANQVRQVRTERGLAVFRRHIQRLPGIQKEV